MDASAGGADAAALLERVIGDLRLMI
jgi:hypothetical protein